jgi:hypothetical protein
MWNAFGGSQGCASAPRYPTFLRLVTRKGAMDLKVERSNLQGETRF